MSGGHLIFWAAVALLAYAYAGYPLLLLAWAALGAREPRAGRHEPAQPMLSVPITRAIKSSVIRIRLESLRHAVSRTHA